MEPAPQPHQYAATKTADSVSFKLDGQREFTRLWRGTTLRMGMAAARTVVRFGAQQVVYELTDPALLSRTLAIDDVTVDL